MVKRSSDPRIAHPEIEVQVRDLVRVVSTVAPFAPRGKPGVQDERGRLVDKRSSDPWVAHPEVKVQVWDLDLVVGIAAPFTARGFSIREKKSF